MTQAEDDAKEARLLVAALRSLDYDEDGVVAHVARYMCEKTLARRITYKPKRFDLAAIDHVTCVRLFRFDHNQIQQLIERLQLPAVIYTSQRCVVPRTEALCLLLRRLAYPARLADLTTEYGRSTGALSSAINETATLIYEKVKKKMNFDQRMMARYKDRSAEAIYHKVGRLDKCVGFIDGTINQTCRPSKFQDINYSGHKKKHGIKFQNIAMANGMIVSMFGPVEGRRHDGYMLKESEVCEEMALYPGYQLYGDQGYPLRSWLITPFPKSAKRTREELRCNRDLSRARIAVEWSFGWIFRYWKFFTLISNMKVFKSPIGMLFVVATFFTNWLSCVRRRNQASKYFRCALPTLDIYLADLNGEDVNEDDYPSDDEAYYYFDDESDMSSGDENNDSASEDESSSDGEAEIVGSEVGAEDALDLTDYYL